MSKGIDRGLSSTGRVLGCGALEFCYLCLFEDGGECGGALSSHHVPSETASEGHSGNDRRASVSTGVDRENTLEGSRLRGVLKVGDLCLAQHLRELGSPLRADAVAVETADEERSGDGERVASMSTGADKKANTRGQRRT